MPESQAVNLYDRDRTPTVEEVRIAAEQSIRNRIDFFQKKLTESTPKDRPAVNEQINEARRHLAEFQSITTGRDIPDGFEIRTVFFSKVDAYQNSLVWEDFTENVRWRFRKFLAHNKAKQLQEFGICDHGIAMMKEGQHPADKDGYKYRFSIDHIVERAGSGRLAFNKAADPKTSVVAEDTYIVNHYKNLMLLPDAMHDLKNTLNETQMTSAVTDGKGKWVLMVMPKKNGFFPPKQSNPAYTTEPARPKVKQDPITVLTGQAKGVRDQLVDFIEDIVSKDNAEHYLHEKLIPAVENLCAGLSNQFASVTKKNDKKKARSCLERMERLLSKDFAHETISMVEVVGLEAEAKRLREVAKKVSEALEGVRSKRSPKAANKSGQKAAM